MKVILLIDLFTTVCRVTYISPFLILNNYFSISVSVSDILQTMQMDGGTHVIVTPTPGALVRMSNDGTGTNLFLVTRNFNFSTFDLTLSQYFVYTHIIALLEETQFSNIGNHEDPESVPIPDYPGAPIFPEAVPVAQWTETSNKEYMADVMDVLTDNKGICLYLKTFLIISTTLCFTNI